MINSSTVRIGLLGLVALLALTGLGGTTLAAGDLFDNDYKDCPHKTRLREGQIADLSVNRDSDDEDEVNISWTATDPATWGLGPNTYRTSLVVILDDGSPDTNTLSLGSRKTTFDNVETGKVVKVQMAIVVDTADGKYLISDILEQSINQSLTEPAFHGLWYRIKRRFDARTDGAEQAIINEVGRKPDYQHDSEPIANGMMYYIGYNENFANYRAGTTNPASYRHAPSTPRLRIGLAHSTKEDSDKRDDVGFDAYIIRIEDSDGDVVNEGDDVATIAISYGTAVYDLSYDSDGNGSADTYKTADKKLFIASLSGGVAPGWNEGKKTTDPALQNVRIVDGSQITAGMHLAVARDADVTPASLSIVKVGVSEGALTTTSPLATDNRPRGARLAVGQVYANPPDEHRDFPIDTLSSDVTYKITAWAVNEDDEVISPVATLNLRPIDETVTLGTGTAGLTDYLNTTAIPSGTLIVTEFTVLK